MITRRDFLRITAASGAFASVGRTVDAQAALQTVLPDMAYVYENKRRIPVIAEVDLAVIGGSSRAVALAVAAARKGCNVFLVAEMPYLGDDICGSFLYTRTEEERPVDALARKVFPETANPSPLHVKSTLENELINYGVDFLYSSYTTEAITDSRGMVAGVIITNRSGRQAIRCRAVADCTHTASVAQLFGAGITPFVPAVQEFQFTVAGNGIKETSLIKHADFYPDSIVFDGKKWPVITYRFSFEMKDNSYASLMKVEQTVRSEVWDVDQIDSADLLWYIPQQNIYCESFAETANVRRLPIQAFMPKNVPNLWVIGACSGLSREAAGQLMRPVNAMFLGSLLGEQIAEQVEKIPVSTGEVKVRQTNSNGFKYGETGEILRPLRLASHKGYVDSPEGSLPLLGEYDVIVLGGGTAGSTAGISAAQQGVKTLMLEYLHGLGGLGTLGMIGRYWDGYREGYTAIIDKGVRDMAPLDHSRQRKDWQEESVSDWKMEWLRREYLSAGGELWFGTLGCGAVTENGKVRGLIVATPCGRGVVLSKTIIDSTGSADIAIAAGAEYDYTGRKTLAVQGAGTGQMNPGTNYNNNDWLFVDDTDIRDVSRAYIQGKIKIRGQYDLVKLPQTRERRRIIAEHTVSVTDVLTHRRYADTISYHRSSFDTHGMIVDPYFLLSPPMERHTIYDADVPLRSLLPKGLDGILVTGLGAGAHRDAMPVIRMRSCLQTQGHSVGYLAAIAVKEGKSLRKMNIRKIQQHLVSIGNLPARVLTDKETKFTDREMETAAKTVSDNYKGLDILLTNPRQCIELTGKHMASASGNTAIIYASILCILGETSAVKIIEDAVHSQTSWDKGWHYTGMGQFGMSLSRLDALLMALGNAGRTSSLSVIMEKAIMLKPEDEFSHYRAVCKAMEGTGSAEASTLLATMLQVPGVRGHDLPDYACARRETVPGMEDTSTRNLALKELHLAGALYRCGDKDGIGKAVLQRYASGLEGHYARYAEELLYR